MQEKLPCKQIITSVGSELHTIPKLEVKQRVVPVVLHLNLSLALPGVNGVVWGDFATTRGRNELHAKFATRLECDLQANQLTWILRK